MQNKKKILITGHTGFKGSWLALWLKVRGHDVYGISLPPQKESLYVLARISEIVTDETYLDIRDGNKLAQWAEKIEPEIVIHLAAQPLVLESYKNPRFTLETNVNGTFNVLEKISNLPSTIATLIITTDKVYKDSELNKAYRETDPLGGKDFYSSSKAMADLLTQSWISSFANKPVAVARAGNVIGGGDFSENRLVPDIYRSIRNQTELKIRFPNSVRPWQHVLDCLNGYLAAIEYSIKGNHSQIWNFGPESGSFKTVDDLILKLAEELNISIKKVKIDSTVSETNFLILDSTKANLELNWKNLLNFEDNIRLVGAWYKEFLSGADARNITEKQIIRYEELALTQDVSRRYL